MKILFIPIIFISLLFSCKKQDEINPTKQNLSFIVQIDEQDKQVLDCRKLCYFADGDKSKIDTIKFCNVGLNTFSVNIKATNFVEFFMSNKMNTGTYKISEDIKRLKQVKLKHVNESIHRSEILHFTSIY